MLGSLDHLGKLNQRGKLLYKIGMFYYQTSYQFGMQRISSSKELAAARTPKIFVIARNVLFYNEKWPRSAIQPLARAKAKPFVVLITS